MNCEKRKTLVLGIIISLLLFNFISVDWVKGDTETANPSTYHKAYYFADAGTSTWGTAGTECASGDYSAMASSDNSRYYYAYTASKYNYVRVDFNITKLANANSFSLTDITNINVIMEGYGEGTPYGYYCAVYDDTDTVWRSSNSSEINGLFSHTSSSDSTLTFDINGSIGDYLSSAGILKISTRTSYQAHLYTDYIVVTITYNNISTPTLSTPSNGATSQALKPTLDWSDSTGGTAPLTYEVMVDNNLDFSSPNVNVTGVASSTYDVPVQLSYNTVYYWKVRTKDDAGYYSDWTSAYSFTTKNLSAPARTAPTNGATGVSILPDITWTHTDAGTGPYTYEIQIDDSSGFGTPAVNVTAISGLTYTVVDALTPSTLYYIRMRAKDANTTPVYSSWASTQSFTTATLTAPTITAPTTGATGISIHPTVTWDVSTGGSGSYTYEIMIDDDSGYGSAIVDVTGRTGTSYSVTADLSPSTVYYIKMRAKDSLNNYSSWTSSNSFTTATLTAPSITAPLNGATGVSAQPTVTWSVSTGGSGTYTYEIMIDDDSGYGSPAVNVTGRTGTSYGVTSTLTAGTVYYIKMRAKDSLNNYSLWTESNAFTVGAIIPPTITAPAGGATGQSIFPTVTWDVSTGGSGSYTYEIMIDDDPAYGSAVVNVTGKTGTSYVVVDMLTPGTNYYVKMRAKDSLNNYSNWTSSNSFTTASFTAPAITSPLGSTTGVSILPTVTWNVSTGGSGTYTYEIMIDDDPAYGSPTVNVIGKTGTSYLVVDDLTPYTLYYVKMRAKDDLNNYSAWTSSNSFTTARFVPPTFTMPTGGMSITTDTPTFSWSASTGGSGTYTYELMVSLNSGFTTTVVDETGIATTSYAMTTNLTPDVHYAKLRALDDLGNYSDWTSTITFNAVTPSAGGASSSPTQNPVVVQTVQEPTASNDIVTTTSSSSSTNIFTKYVVNPTKTVFINPLRELWNWFLGLFRFSGQDEIIDIMETPVGVNNYKAPLYVVVGGAVILILAFGDGIKMPKFKMGKKKKIRTNNIVKYQRDYSRKVKRNVNNIRRRII